MTIIDETRDDGWLEAWDGFFTTYGLDQYAAGGSRWSSFQSGPEAVVSRASWAHGSLRTRATHFGTHLTHRQRSRTK